MANDKNQFIEARVAKVNFTYTNISASTALTSGVYIPTGALVTGVTLLCTGTNSTNGLAQTYSICAGAIPLISLTTISQGMPAQTVASRPTLATAAGNYISTVGEIGMYIASYSGAGTGYFAPDVYVGYIV
jgi:hypothetical protein